MEWLSWTVHSKYKTVNLSVRKSIWLPLQKWIWNNILCWEKKKKIINRHPVSVVKGVRALGNNCCKINLTLIWVTMTGAPLSPGQEWVRVRGYSGSLLYPTIILYQIKRLESMSSLQSVSTSCQNLTSHLLKVIVIVWHLIQVMILT